MNRVELVILYFDGNSAQTRAVVNKWKFLDAMMGEQYITFNITSEKPIDWAIGDYCVFRDQTYTLNYVPSVTQKAGTNERQDAYTYENVKFESFQEELTRCLMLDITASTGDYVAALGTNYTGSSKFQLFCGEVSVGGDTLTAVCALAAKMQANLDRMYSGARIWKIYVDTTTAYVSATGDTVLSTHTEDKVLSFDNTTVAQALAEVHNTFDLDYCIRGREIYIGYNLKNLTSDNDNETFAFGYGKGYPTRTNQNKALFLIKRIANSQQKIVTRLRALGSTKNMPYRYYNKAYNLSQSLFPTNLQLPDTFATPATKATNNATRDSIYGVDSVSHLPNLRHVKGDTNDAYIDKNDDAAACAEGIREDSARWDGSNGDLPEIYPTIEEATYGELRGALVQDQDGNTGNGSFPNYGTSERIDKLLAVGYYDNATLVDDANKGDGILPESGLSSKGIPRAASIGSTYIDYNPLNYGDWNYNGGTFLGEERLLFSIQGVMPGKYGMAPTLGAVIYGFSLSCYRDGCSCDVGYIIKVKQKNVQTGVVTTIATYTSDAVSTTRADGIVEMELPELPDVVNGANAKVNEIQVTALSDITVTFTPYIRNVSVPNGFTDSFSIGYQVANSRLDHSVTYEPEYTWFTVDESSTITDRFHVFVQDMGFDFEACWSDDTPVMAMKSGYCVGREFEIMQDIQKVTYGNKKGYMLTLKRAEDSSLNTYYPSQTDPISAGDNFVLLGIQMPDAYIKMAEVRLLRAATQFLADNCETMFKYQPSIDDIYLQRNYDNMVNAGTPEKSIFWRLYAGLKFTFRGVPSNADDPAPLADITIEKVSISMGEGLTPKVELTLNDDVQQGTIQKLTTSVDRIYNGSIFGGGSGSEGATGAMSAALMSLLQSEGDKLFLSKVHDDEADGKITFNDVVTHKETLKAKKGLKVGNFQSRFLGSGALIDEHGNAEFESIYSRSFISTPEFRFNRISVTEGEQWNTNGYGTIEDVEILSDTTGIITLKLEENDYASIETGDICRGIYNDIAHQYETASLDDDSELYAGENEGDGYGFSSKAGFFTSYFWVRSFITKKKGECQFVYELRNAGTPHPCAFMKFAQYGSFTNAYRRSSSYATSIGHYYEMVLDGVSTWKIHSANVVFRKGYLGDMTVELKNGEEAELEGYGLYAQDNVYFGNAVVQLDPLTLADIEESLKSYEVNFSDYVDVITVDDVGNCIGGLYTISGSNNEYKNYRIHSAISVRKSGNPLLIAADNEDAADGTYKIYAQPVGCTCTISNSTLFITSIDNIKDGVAGTEDDANFDYDAMRNMDSCRVDIIIDCEGKGSIQKSFPVRIKHDSQPYVGADISNEFSAVSWNTQTQAYIGLPITFDMKMWHNNIPLDIESVNDVSVTPAITGMTVTKSIVTNSLGTKVARISITALPASLPLVTDLNITAVATYSGVQYERTLVHTINKTTDTNIYQLLPSVSEVGVIYNDFKQKVLNTNTVYCSVRCDSTDDKHYTVPTSDYSTHGLYITYQTFSLNNNNVEVGGSEAAYSNVSGVTVGTDMTRIRFKLYKLRNTTLSTLSALLASSNVIDVLDIEDVPVILDGLDGDDSIQVILSNDSDSVMCVEDGTVIASTLPVTHACLMDGNDAIGGSTLGTTLAQNKQSLGTFSSGTLTKGWSIVCTNCTAEIVGWTTIDSKPFILIEVKTVTDDTASVNVKCLYTKHGQAAYYSRLFTFNKLYGIDKHEIMLNPNSICYKANDDSYTPTKFQISIYKTTQAQDRHLMTTLPRTGTDASPVEGDYRLQYSKNKGSSWTTLTGYNSGVYIRESSDSGSGNKFSWDDSDSIEVRLQIYIGSEWVLLDQECEDIVADGLDGKGVEFIFLQQNAETPLPTIYDVAADRQVDNYCPYTDAQHSNQWTDEPSGVSANMRFEFQAQRKKVNGVWQPFGAVTLRDRYAADGITPYLIDLSNEQSFVNCDENGNVLSGATYETSKLMLFKGQSYAFTDFNITITPTNISCNGNSSAFNLTASEKNTSQTNGYFTLTPSAITQNSAQITVTATLKTNSSFVLTAVYKINKNMGGQNGVIYELMPSINVVHKNNSGTLTNTTMSVQIKKVVGTTITTLTTSTELSNEGLTLKYTQGSSSTENTISNPASIDTATLLGNNTYFTLLLKKSSTVVDKERINTVCDGNDGADGADGADGDDAVNYELIPVPSSINFHSNGNNAAYSPSYVQVYCGYKKIVGGNETKYPGNVIANLSNIGDNNCSIFYRYQNSNDTYSSWEFLKDYPVGTPTGILPISSSTSIIGVEFAMSSATSSSNVADSNIVARCLVPVIKTKDGDDGQDGQQGYRGCRQRVFEQFQAGFEYHNDEANPSNSSWFVDFLVVEDSLKDTGYAVYQCKTTHTSASTFNADISNWEDVSNFSAAFFKYLIAKNATVKLLASTQLQIMNGQDPIAGFANSDYPLWIGGASPINSNFRVSRGGRIYAYGAEISGVVKAKLFYSPTKSLTTSDFTNNAYTINPTSDPAHTFVLDHPSSVSDLTIILPNAATYDGLEMQFLLIQRTRSLIAGVILSGALTWRDELFGESSSAYLIPNEFVTLKAMSGRWFAIQGKLGS